jgi:hypothetical protein
MVWQAILVQLVLSVQLAQQVLSEKPDHQAQLVPQE